MRGLEPDVDEAALHYTFAKFGPIKELKVIRDRNTLVSRGFAFVHFNTVSNGFAFRSSITRLLVVLCVVACVSRGGFEVTYSF